MSLVSKIQNSELTIMKAIWKAGGTMSLANIRAELAQSTDWEDPTIKTFVRRLNAKGVIVLERRGVYRAVVTQEEYDLWASRSFVDKVFSGSAKALAATLVSDGKLTAEDIRELSEMFRVKNNE